MVPVVFITLQLLPMFYLSQEASKESEVESPTGQSAGAVGEMQAASGPNRREKLILFIQSIKTFRTRQLIKYHVGAHGKQWT